MSKLKCFLFILALLGMGCKTTGVVNTRVNLPKQSPAYLIQQLEKNLPKITWLDGRASVTLMVEGRTQRFSSQIRMKRDSAFVANGKKLSTEGGRIQITRDSFYLLNRVQKSIEIKTFEKVTEAYAIPLDFDELMNVLLGMPIRQMEAADFTASIATNTYRLKGRHGYLDVIYTLDGADYHIQKMEVKDLRSLQSCEIHLDEYQTYGSHTLAGLRTFAFNNGRGQQVSMKVDFSKIELNVPKSIKFSIPPGFTLLD